MVVWVQPECEQQEPVLTNAFNTQHTSDYFGVYLVGTMTGKAEPWAYQSTGVPCSGATEPELCEAEFASALLQMSGFAPDDLSRFEPPSLSWDFLAYYREFSFVLLTRGNSVEVLANESTLQDFLGATDTPNEAALRMFLAGYLAPCYSSLAETAKGYDAFYSTSLCSSVTISVPRRGPPFVSDYIARISRDTGRCLDI